VNKYFANVETQRRLPSPGVDRTSSSRRPSKGWVGLVRKHAAFILIVLLPTLFGSVYYGLLAAPIYRSTAQFLVKNSNPSSAVSGVGQFLQSTGLTPSASDAYSVGAYITSRDALAELEKDGEIRSIYNRPEADFIARFPSFYNFFRSSFEHLYWHYLSWIEVDFDSTTNITTIYAYAFRPADAHTVARQLLVLGEHAVNRMNDRVKQGTLRVMKEEVSDLQRRAEAIQSQITDFRNSELILDPNQTSTAATTLRSTLESTLVAARALLDQLQQVAPGSPQIPALRTRIKALEDQVAHQERKDSGGANTLAPKISQYDTLLFQQKFAQQMLQAAVTSLEAAEVGVQQQLLYIERIAEPRIPDWPQNPYRLLDMLLTLVTALLIYGIGRIFYSIIKEHVSA
jgi:capsular polysaccharide transport system permease protein